MDSKENLHHSHHRHGTKYKIKKWLKNNGKIVFVLILLLLFLLAILIDRNSNKNISNEEDVERVSSVTNNYDGIITIIDGEGELTFTDIWGDLIQEGYPVCSNLVSDYVGKEGYMDWNTIKSLNNVGIEFVFHTSDHKNYNEMEIEDVISNIENGIKKMDEYNLPHDLIVWTNYMRDEIYQMSKDYFKGGFAYSDGIDTIKKDKSSPIKMQYHYDASNYSLEQLVELINETKVNNGWLILFTRNTEIDSNQIDVYRKALEYAEENNIAVVAASEGYDLYYGNKLGNN